MYDYAASINKFSCLNDALLYHYHPSFVTEERDDTHNIIRGGKVSPKSKDILTNTIRRQKGLVWGKSFELVNK